jgi:hypothetical protein
VIIFNLLGLLPLVDRDSKTIVQGNSKEVVSWMLYGALQVFEWNGYTLKIL